MNERIDSIYDLQKIQQETQSVLDALAKVEANMEKLTGKNISIAGGSKDISTVKEATAALNQLSDAQVKSATIKRQGIEVGSQLYKSLEAEKQAYKELKKEVDISIQKDNEKLSAYKRLEAEAKIATNEFKNLAATYGVESEQAQKAGARAGELNAKLKEIDATVHLHQRNVGNYKDALGQTADTQLGLISRMRAMKEELVALDQAGQGNTARAKQLTKEYGLLRDSMADVQARSKFWADDYRWLTATTQAVQGLVGAYSAFTGIMMLAGDENEDLQKSMRKLQSLMVIMMGIQQMSNALNKDSMVIQAKNVIVDKARAFWTGMVSAATVKGTIATKAATSAEYLLAAAKKASMGLWGLLAAAIAAGVKIYSTAISRTKEMREAQVQSGDQLAIIKQRILEFTEALDTSNESLYGFVDNMQKLGQTKLAFWGELAGRLEEVVEAQKVLEQLPPMMGTRETRKELEAMAKQAVAMAANFDKMNKDEIATFIINLQTLSDKYQQQAKTGGLMGESLELQKRAVDQIITALTVKVQVTEANNKSTKEATKSTKEFADATRIAMADLQPSQEYYKKMWDESLAKIQQATEGLTEYEGEVQEVAMATRTWADESRKIMDELPIDWDKLIDKAEKYAGAVTGILSNVSTIIQANAEADTKVIDSEYQKQQAALQRKLDEGIISQAEYDQQRLGLENDYTNQKKELDKKEFQRKKALALAESIINQTLALIKVWSSDGSTLEKVLYSALAASEFAALVAQLKAQSPGYAKGRDGGPAEFAKVGEQGFEYIRTATGYFKTPNTSTLTYLPAGADVIPHPEAVKLESIMSQRIKPLPDRVLSTDQQGWQEVKKAIMNKKEVHINISKSGVSDLIRAGHNWTKHINDNVKL